MGEYTSFRSTRTTRGLDDDDFVTSKNPSLHRLAADTLLDNDEIARRSRGRDEKLLNQITNKLHTWEVDNQKPGYEVRSLVESSSRRNIDDTERRRAALRNPVLRRATHEKRASARLSDDEVIERPRSLILPRLDDPAATLRHTYSPLREVSPYASPFKYTSLADEFSAHKPYTRRYGAGSMGLTTSSSTRDLSPSPVSKLGSELIRSTTRHINLDDDEDLENLDVRELFQRRKVVPVELSDDEDEPYQPPPPARATNGTYSPAPYEYNYDDYEDDDSYLYEGDVFQRAGEISRRFKSGEGLYGDIDYHKRLYSPYDYTTAVYSRKSDNLSDDLDTDYTPSYTRRTRSADYDEEYTPAHKYRPSVAALDSSLPRSRLEQSESWMDMQSKHRAVENCQSTSILDRIRVKAALLERTLPPTPRRKKFLSAGSYSDKDHSSTCINHVAYESKYSPDYDGSHRSREATRSDPGFKNIPPSISPEPRKDYKPEYYVFSPDEERKAPSFDDEEDTVVISAKKPTVVVEDEPVTVSISAAKDEEEDDEPITVSFKPAEAAQVATVAPTAESVVPLELEEQSPEKEADAAK